MKSLEPYVEHFFVGIKKWPGTITKDNHKIMIVYRSCTESRKLLDEMPNLFCLSKMDCQKIFAS